MKISEGKLTLSVAYGVKVPGEADFSSMEARLGYELEFPVEGEEAAIRDKAEALEAEIISGLKLAVFGQLGLEAIEKDGVVLPDLSHVRTATVKQGQSKYPPKKSNSGGGGGQQFAPGKAQEAGYTIPTYTIRLGDGLEHEIQDCRDAISLGIYKQGAPAFRVDGEPVWQFKKDGNTLTGDYIKIAEAVAPFVPFDNKVEDEAPANSSRW